MRKLLATRREDGRYGPDLIVVDSIRAMTSRESGERIEDGREDRIGSEARMNAREMRSIVFGTSRTPRLSDTETCLVFTNHVIAKISAGGGWGPKIEESPGGRALKYYASIRLRTSVVGKDERKDDTGRPARIKLRIKAEKNKLAAPFGQCEVWLDWTNRIMDDEQFVVDVAMEKGMVGQKGSWFTWNPTGERFQGREKLLGFLRENNVIGEILGENGRADDLEAVDESEEDAIVLK